MLPSRQPWTCVWCDADNTGFRQRNDPAAASVGEFAACVADRHLELAPLEVAVAAASEPMLIVTTNEIPGYRITAVHGDVFGLTVQVRDTFSNMGARFMTIVGGEVTAYTKLLTASRNEARQRMWQEARARGANAVVGMRFDCNSIAGIMTEIAAYGTAVSVAAEPASSSSGDAWLAPVDQPQRAATSPTGF